MSQRASGGFMMRQALTRGAIALALGIVGLLSFASERVQANGTPVTIVLSYLDGVSNFGPRNATGVAEITTKESELHLTATGLQRLSGDEYEVWIANTNTSRRMALTRFNAGEDGKAVLDLVVNQEIPDIGWNLMMLSVEPQGTSSAEPNNRRSIAGRFPDPSTVQGQPGALPRTGGGPDTGGPMVSPLLIVALLSAAALGVTAGAVFTRKAMGGPR